MELPASHGRRYLVEAGVLDDRAQLAFRMGHCHSMALAIHQATGGELLGLAHHQTPYDHILVAGEGDRLIDVGGTRSTDEVQAGGHLHPVSSDEVVALPDYGWVPPQPEVAALWVPEVLARIENNEPYVEPRCFSYDFVLDLRLDVHLEWSIVDTADRLTAFGRPPENPNARWARCAVMSIRDNPLGEPIIDFREESFVDHTRRFVELLRARPDVVVARALDPEDPQQPLCPP
ncbi:MAG TPA: hypothetical protein VF533_05980 [Solirubrobacteraceae bacterium]|jgi:hypothetical protein